MQFVKKIIMSMEFSHKTWKPNIYLKTDIYYIKQVNIIHSVVSQLNLSCFKDKSKTKYSFEEKKKIR